MSSSPAWSPTDIRSELDALAVSKSFRRSLVLSSLLRFLVETELRGEGETLKETYIGTVVYRRAADYDPRTDGIVRVNANRLRTRLEDHYRETPSRLKIILRAGSYRPVFEVTAPPVEQEPPSPLPSPPALVVEVTVPRRSRWPLWTAAAALLIAGFALFWMLRTSQHWNEQALSPMTGLQSFADFSPDGRRIAYAVEDTGSETSWLYVQELASGQPTKVSTENRYETRPAWSPDGNSLAFVVRDKDSLRVMVRPLHGGPETGQGDAATEIFSRPHSGPWFCDVPHLSWTPDGTEIVTVAPPAPAELTAGVAPSLACGVVAVNVRTHAVRHITWGPAKTQGDLEPVVSPDGKTVAFLRENSYAVVDVYLASMDGKALRRLPLKSDDIQGIAWTPDGDGLLLCMRLGVDQVHIVRFDLARQTAEAVQSSAAPMAFAAISRDGHHIAFTEYHQTNKVLRLTHTALTDLFADSALRANAVPSPDGRFIAYSSDRSGRNQIWVSDADGHNERQITSTSGAGANRPVWTPDGKSLIYECRESTSSSLCVQRLNGGKPSVLEQMGSDAILPSLAHDGSKLYFTANVTGDYEGYVQRLRLSPSGDVSADGKPEQLTVGGARFLYESYSGKSLDLLGREPELNLLNIPLDNRPPLIPSTSVPPGSLLLLQHDASLDSGAVLPQGLLVVQQRAGSYHFLFFHEGVKNSVEPFPPQNIDPIDSVSWDPARDELLLTTRSKPTGTLRLLSND